MWFWEWGGILVTARIRELCVRTLPALRAKQEGWVPRSPALPAQDLLGNLWPQGSHWQSPRWASGAGSVGHLQAPVGTFGAKRQGVAAGTMVL